jgi:hypothetical protein
MREIRTSGSEGGGSETNRCSPPLSVTPAVLRSTGSPVFADDDTVELRGSSVVPFQRNPP